MSRLFCVIFAFSLAAAVAEPISAKRLQAVPPSEQAAWNSWLARSVSNAAADQAAIQAEVAANKMAVAIQAPSGGDFSLPAKAGDPWYATDDAKRLAATVLSFQTPSGGWSKHLGFSKGPRRPGMQWSSQNEPWQHPHYVATFDNRSTTEEMYFLANLWRATRRGEYKAAFIRGLKFIFAAQFPNGGWPQVYPLEGGYHDDITFNDDAMTHILELLSGVAHGDPAFSFVDASDRQMAAAALNAGISSVLKMQIVRDGKKTVWCAQYDPLTLQPAPARKFEPATFSGLESAHILEFLMTLSNPPPAIVASIEGGLAWLDAAKITGLRRTNINGKTAFPPDPNSTAVFWARFYDLETGNPVFPGRDGVVYNSFAEMAAKNDLGYDYYSTQPGSLLKTKQKKWRQMLATSGASADSEIPNSKKPK